ncbi:hypothetical protein DPMN_145649 [Dreissena polymorpha]|uniref:Uncharacterized protein n=1 Tax=Dreissena polymorpha TaxID=45954 RepID=A0A9D4F5B3_DREPO|nr:hypothetical protein DPMN_145649 [Dreissena polymorpha]
MDLNYVTAYLLKHGCADEDLERALFFGFVTVVSSHQNQPLFQERGVVGWQQE